METYTFISKLRRFGGVVALAFMAALPAFAVNDFGSNGTFGSAGGGTIITNWAFGGNWSQGSAPASGQGDINVTNVFLQDTIITNASGTGLNFLRIVSGGPSTSSGSTSNITVITSGDLSTTFGFQIGRKATLIIAAGNATISGNSFDLTGGGTLAISNGATFFINNTADVSASGGTIILNAAGGQTSGINYAQGGHDFINASGNTIVMSGAGTGTFTGNFGGNNKYFNNAGTILVNSGTLLIDPRDAFTNNGFTNSGSVFISSGATFVIRRTNNSWNNGGDSANTGYLVLNGGTITTIDDGGQSTTRTIRNAGTIMGNGTLAFGLFNPTSGGMVIASNGVLSVGTVFSAGQGTWVATNFSGLNPSVLQFTVSQNMTAGTFLNSNGTLRANGASISLSSTFRRNDGTLDLVGGGQFLPSTNSGLSAFTNSATGVISGNGTLVNYSPGVASYNFINQGQLLANVNAGTLTIRTEDSTTSGGFSNASTGVILVSNGAFFAVAKTSAGWAQDVFNAGTIFLNNGSIVAFNTTTGLTTNDRPFNNSGTVVGNGTFSMAVFNSGSGKIIASNGVLSIGTVYSTGAGTWIGTNFGGAAASVLEFRTSADLSSGTFLNSNGTIRIANGASISLPTSFQRNDGTLELAGGSITYTATTVLTNTATGVLSGNGTVAANVSSVRNLGLIVATNGVLNFSGNLSNTATGFIRLDGGATVGALSNSVAWANPGAITNLGGRLLGGNVTNSGSVIGFGTNNVSFINVSGGSVTVTNGTMGFTGAIFSNASGGTIRVSDASTLSGNTLTNLGTVLSAVGTGTGFVDAAIFNASGGTLQITNSTLRAAGDLVNAGLINIGTATSSGTLSNNNLYLAGNGQITFTNASGIAVNTLLVGGAFSNTTSSIINLAGAGGGSALLRFLDNTRTVTNSGTLSFQIVGAAGATVTLQVGSDATAGTLLNNGTIVAALGGASTGRAFTFSNIFVNANSFVITNTSSSGNGTISFTATRDVTNQVAGTVRMFLSGAASSTLTLSTGNFINLGTNVLTTTVGTGGNAINLNASGAVYSNASSGWILLGSDNVGTNRLLIGAAGGGGGNVINAGTISVAGGTLLIQSTGGGTRGLRNTGTIFMMGGNLETGSGVTNFGTITGWGTLIGSVINTNGFVLADARTIAGRASATLTVSLSNFTNFNGATLGSIGTNSTLLVSIANSALINNGTIQLSAGSIVLSNTLTGTTGGTITNLNTIAGVGDVSTFPIVQGAASASLIALDPTDGLTNLIATVGSINTATLGAVSNANGIATLQLTLSSGATTLSNAGTLLLRGGAITINGLAGTITNTGFIFGFGGLSNAVANVSGGTILASNMFRFGALNNANAGVLSNFDATSRLLLTNSILVNSGRIALNSGAIILSGSTITNTGTITGPGDVASALYNDTGGFVAATNGVLNLATNSGEFVVNVGTFDISSGSTLSNAPSAWNNSNGTVRIAGGTLSGGITTNKGVISGNGTVMSTVFNDAAGTVRATNGILTLRQTAITQNGTLIGGTASGTYLQITNLTGFFNNSGTMVLDGSGNVAFYILQDFSNTTAGVVTGAGILRTADNVIGGGGANFNIRNAGNIIATNGTLIVDSGDGFSFGFNNAVGATVTVANAATFGIDRSTNAWLNALAPVNNGVIVLAGGTVQALTNSGTGPTATTASLGISGGKSDIGVISNSLNGTIQGFGTFNPVLLNLGTVVATNGTLQLANTASLTMSGTFQVQNSATLDVRANSGTLFVSGQAQLFGGSIFATGAITQVRITSSGSLVGFGQFMTSTNNGTAGGNEFINSGGTIIATNGTLFLNSGNAFTGGGLSNSANAEIRVASGAAFTFNRTVNAWNNAGTPTANAGLIALFGGSFNLASDGTNDNARFITSSGTIVGNGTFFGSLTNAGGTIDATNGTLIVNGSGRFSQNGTLTVEQGGTLALTNSVGATATTFSNAGTINMRGGTLLAGVITNATTIAGLGTIEGGGVANGGTILASNLTASAGTLTVRLSSFTNTAAATLSVLGTNAVLDVLTPGNAPFLVNLGTINLSAGRITNSLAGGFTITNFFVIAGVGDLSSLPVVNTGATASIIAQNPTQGISNFNASVSVTNTAILGANNIGGAATLSLTVGNGSQGLVNNGTIALNGGFITFNGDGTPVTNLTGQIYGNGQQANLNVVNLSGGSVVASNGTLRFGATGNLNQGLLSNFNSSATLLLTNTVLVNTGRIALNGGGFIMAGSIVTNQGTITGPGNFADSLYNDTAGFVAATNGILNLATNGAAESVQNLGTFDISSGSTLSNAVAWNNTNGTVRINAGTLSGGATTNKGTIAGNGTIMSTVVNAAEGTVRATNGVLALRATTISQSGTMIGGTAAGTYIQVTNLTGFFNNNGTMLLDSPSGGTTNLSYYILGDFSNAVGGVIRGAGILRSADNVVGGGGANFSIRNMGRIEATNGALIVDSGDAFGYGFNNGAGSTITVANASTFGIARSTNAWLNSTTNPVNNGAILLSGGVVQTYTNSGTGINATPVADSSRTISNSVTGLISGNGSLNLNLINIGTVNATNGTLVLAGTAAFTNSGTIAIQNGATFTTLQNTGTFLNNGTLLLAGGTFVGTNFTQFRDSAGVISGFGTINTGKTSGSGGANAEIVNVNNSLIVATNGTLFLNPGDAFASGGFSNSASSTVRVEQNASVVLNRTANAWDLSVGSGFSNPRNLGTINFNGGSWSNFSDGVSSPGRFLENYGTIFGHGNVSGSLTNFGTIAPTNGTLIVDGTGKFRQAGTLSIDLGGTLRLTNSTGAVGLSFTNEAQILMRGGELQAGVIANTNVIFGFGTISGGGVDNSGQLLASNGTLVAGLSSFTNRSTATLGTLSTNSTLDITIPGGVSQPLINQGTISLAGGTLLFNGSSSGTISNRTTGTIIGVGDVTQTVINNGTILAANPVSGLTIFSVGLSDLNSAVIGASNGATLNVVISGGAGSSFNNNGSISMIGGTLIISNGAPGVITNNSMITGNGTIVPAIVNLKTNAATVNGGTLDITLFGGTNTSSGYLLAAQGATLQIQSNLVNLGTIAANGLNGGTIQIAQASGIITNLNLITGSGGLTFNSFVHNGATGVMLATNGVLTFNAINGLANTGTIGIANNGTFQSNSSNSWANAGTIDLRGGTLRTGGYTNAATSAIFTNTGFINGYGTLLGGGAYGLSGAGIDKSIANLGMILVTNPLSSSAATLTIDSGGATTANGIANLGNIVISSNTTLVLNRQTGLPILNTGTITIFNGTLTGSGVLSNTAGGIIQGYGTLSHQIVNASGGTIRATNGNMVMTSSVNPINSGTLEIDNASTMTWNSSNSWLNAGTVDLRNGTLRTGGATIVFGGGEPFTNANYMTGFGTIIGGGAFGGSGSGFDKAILNTGTIIANGGLLVIDTGFSTLSNGIANFGTMIVSNSTDTLELRRAAESLAGHLNFIENTGTIILKGGTLTANAALTNRATGILPGLIQGFGRIAISNDLVNSGTIRSTNGVLRFINPLGGDVLDVRQSGTLVVENGSEMIFGAATNAPLVNSGTIVMRGGNLLSGFFTNRFGATFTGFGSISASIFNSGTGMATSASAPLYLTGASLFNQTNGVLGARNGQLWVTSPSVFTNAGTVSFLNSVGTFNGSVVNQGAWTMDPSTNVFYGNFTVATNGYITMTSGDVSIMKSNFFNSSLLSNQYDTVAGKFLFDGDDGLPGTYTQQFYVAGLDLGGSNFVAIGTLSQTNAYRGGTEPIWGFTNNFALGTLEIGSLSSTSALTLLDSFRADLLNDDGSKAALYVDTLTINSGSLLIISNNVELYFKNSNGVTGVSFDPNNLSGADVLILGNGSFHQLGVVPEPSILLLLIVGSVGIYWRRRRKSNTG